jgi:hypothetical protein
MKSTYMEDKEAKHAEWKERRDNAFRSLLEANKHKDEAYLVNMANEYAWEEQIHD